MHSEWIADLKQQVLLIYIVLEAEEREREVHVTVPGTVCTPYMSTGLYHIITWCAWAKHLSSFLCVYV